MASKSVIINGVTYGSVPAVEIPLSSGSGNATFTETSDATLASGAQMLSGYTAYADGTLYTGTIATKTSSNLTVSGATVTAAAGYYASSASKSVASGSATTPATTITATPELSIDSGTGEVTATVSASQSITPTVSAGYVSSGTAGTVTASGSDTLQLTTQGATTITPTTSAQTVSAGTYLTGAVTVEGDANLVSGYIADGVSIFGVEGSLSSPTIIQDSSTKVLTIA